MTEGRVAMGEAEARAQAGEAEAVERESGGGRRRGSWEE